MRAQTPKAEAATQEGTQMQIDQDNPVPQPRTPRTPGLSQSTFGSLSKINSSMFHSTTTTITHMLPMPTVDKPITEPVLDVADRKGVTPALRKGFVLRERWFIEGKIGGGAYGQIYRAQDKRQKNQHVAVKVELQTKKRDSRRLVLETHLLKEMQDPRRIYMPELYGAGAVDHMKLNFVVMQLLSRNLADLRRISPLNKFTVSTSYRVARQVLAALRDLHQFGYLHRDLKPSNLALGIDVGNKHNVYLIDYGLVRRFKTPEGKLRKPRERVGFRGTLRYCALRVHNRLDNCQADDLWSWFYTLVEMCVGSLPWRQLSDPARVKTKKENFKVKVVCASMPRATLSIAKYLDTLDFGMAPDYVRIDNYISEALQSVCAGPDDPYDWETHYRSVLDEKRNKIK